LTSIVVPTNILPMRLALVVMGLFCVVLGSACASSPQGVVMGKFIPDDKLAKVRICGTTGQELVQSFGTPSGQGRDGDMGTLTWNAAAIVHDSEQSAVGTQSVHAWVDPDGLVAGFVVNPTSAPTKPAPCSQQQPDQDPTPEPAPAKEPEQAELLRATSRRS
jgi:hypothetical protein